MNKKNILIILIILMMTACLDQNNLTPKNLNNIVKYSENQEKLKMQKLKEDALSKKIKIKKKSFYLSQRNQKKLYRNKLRRESKLIQSIKLKGPYRNNKILHKFINRMVKKYNIKRYVLNQIFSNVKRDVKALKLMGVINGVEKKRLYSNYTWTKYKNIFITKNRISKGVKTYKNNKKYFEQAEKKFGVPAEYLVAILGIETNYGTITGTFTILDSLTSIAVEHPRRSKFFLGELEALLHLNLIENKIPLNLKASYAGAFGFAQFMPSSFQEYAIDFDGDGKINFFSFPDTIGSIANYFKRYHWNKNIKVASKLKHDKRCHNSLAMGFKNKYLKKDLIKAKIPIYKNHPFLNNKNKFHIIKLKKDKTDELWLATNNFYVITRYNHSDYYAMVVHQLSQEIKKIIR